MATLLVTSNDGWIALIYVIWALVAWGIPLALLISAVVFFRNWRAQHFENAARDQAQRNRIIELMEDLKRDRQN